MSETVNEFIVYVTVMLIVIYIGISIVLGVNPLKWGQQARVSDLFEPGKIYTNYKLEDYTRLDCSGSIRILTLDGVKFGYRVAPSSSLDKIDFIIVLDHQNLLFLGRNEETNDPKITCKRPEGSGDFECPNTKLRFELKGIKDVSGKQTFHLTAWKALPVVVDATQRPETCSETGAGTTCVPTTLSAMLESYPDSYLSSFDDTIDIGAKCKETECRQLPENECKDKNSEGCYWGGWFSSSCEPCPSSTLCGDYKVPGECAQCPIPRSNCEVGSIATFWSCKPKGS
jgi:hypothetical protein